MNNGNLTGLTYEEKILEIAWDIMQSLPDENEEVIPGIQWGNSCQLFTPAFWKLQYLLNSYNRKQNSHKLGGDIYEEVVACLLGGYGIPAEIGLLAFERLKDERLIVRSIEHSKLKEALSRPFNLSDNRQAVYRFYNQKSKYIYEFLNRSDLDKIPVQSDVELREWLLLVKGIGLKTASWITRNWLGSNNVAILDIHLLRAGKLTGFFTGNTDVSKSYYSLEKEYLSFCKAMKVSASDLDAIIWEYMKKANKFAIRALKSF